VTDGLKGAFELAGAKVGLGLRPKNIDARVKRVEDPRLLTGQGAFTVDRLVSGAAGGAAALAARLLKERVIRAASHLLEASVADIEAADGRVFVGGTDRSLTFEAIAKAVYSEMGRLPRDAREELEVTKVCDPYFGTTTSATHIVAVEIDPVTYKANLDRYVVVEDGGRVINPMLVDGQVHGAGRPRHRRDPLRGGHLRRCRSAADRQPRRLCHPDRERGAIDNDRPSRDSVPIHRGRLPRDGRRGTIGAPAAIANALADALAPFGAEIFELPIPPSACFVLSRR
jgi:carbon-monoxide dehydrogenase large subunit